MEISYSKSLTTKDMHYVWCYSEAVLSGYTRNQRNDFERFCESGGAEQGAERTHYVRSTFSLYRTKSNMKYLIELNRSRYSKFVTFTFKKAPKDRTEAIKAFKTLPREYRKKYNEKLKYLFVLERGSGTGDYIDDKGRKRRYTKRWHVHAVLFNDRFITLTDMRKLWRYGSARVNALDDTSNIGRYLMKYVTKDTMTQTSKKGYISSNGLIKPSYVRHPERLDIDPSICSYTKHFTRPKYQNGKLIGYSTCTLYEIPIT